jgi:hypothetical protein
MKDTLNLFKDVVRHPSQTVEVLKEKSLRLGLLLLLINIILSGGLFGYSKFVMDPSEALFWLLTVVVGMLFALFLGAYIGVYYSISKFVLKEDKDIGLKVLSYYFLIAFTLYHIIATVFILIFIPLQEYYIAISFYDVSHVVLLFWIAALCVQGIQALRQEQEFRTMLKVFVSLFVGYCIQMIVFLIVSTQIIGLIYR